MASRAVVRIDGDSEKMLRELDKLNAKLKKMEDSPRRAGEGARSLTEGFKAAGAEAMGMVGKIFAIKEAVDLVAGAWNKVRDAAREAAGGQRDDLGALERLSTVVPNTVERNRYTELARTAGGMTAGESYEFVFDLASSTRGVSAQRIQTIAPLAKAFGANNVTSMIDIIEARFPEVKEMTDKQIIDKIWGAAKTSRFDPIATGEVLARSGAFLGGAGFNFEQSLGVVAGAKELTPEMLGVRLAALGKYMSGGDRYTKGLASVDQLISDMKGKSAGEIQAEMGDVRAYQGYELVRTARETGAIETAMQNSRIVGGFNQFVDTDDLVILAAREANRSQQELDISRTDLGVTQNQIDALRKLQESGESPFWTGLSNPWRAVTNFAMQIGYDPKSTIADAVIDGNEKVKEMTEALKRMTPGVSTINYGRFGDQ